MGISKAPSHLTLNDIERSKSRPLEFRSLISHKGVHLGHIFLLNMSNRKLYMGCPTAVLDLTLSDLERSNSRLWIFQTRIHRSGA